MIKNIKINRLALLISACAITSWSGLSHATTPVTTNKSYYLDTSNYERNYTTGSNRDYDSKRLYLKLGLGSNKSFKPKGYYKGHVGNSSSFNIGIGGNLISNNRLELNFIKRNGFKYREEQSTPLQIKSIISATIKSETIMLNFYSDQYITEMFNPYFGFGVGYTKNKVNFNRNTTIGHRTISRNQLASKSAFAWQAVIGVNLPVHQKIAFDLSYRYSHLGRLPSIPNQISLDNRHRSGSKLKTQEILFSILLKI
jgi:opacity protein-like surface antigen